MYNIYDRSIYKGMMPGNDEVEEECRKEKEES
jgi:hypothetical protein